MRLTCRSCERSFLWTEEEQLQALLSGDHAYDDCHEGLDTKPCQQISHYVPQECKSCRPKQDGQRS